MVPDCLERCRVVDAGPLGGGEEGAGSGLRVRGSGEGDRFREWVEAPEQSAEQVGAGAVAEGADGLDAGGRGGLQQTLNGDIDAAFRGQF